MKRRKLDQKVFEMYRSSSELIAAVIVGVSLCCFLVSTSLVAGVQAQTKWPNSPPRSHHNQQTPHMHIVRQVDRPNQDHANRSSQRDAVYISPVSKVKISAGQVRDAPIKPTIEPQRAPTVPLIGSTPSSIGKHERNQVADWPFFKSLQSARKDYNAEKYYDIIMEAKRKSIVGSEQQPQSAALDATEPSEAEQPATVDMTDGTTTTTTTSTSTTTSTTTEAPTSSTQSVESVNLELSEPLDSEEEPEQPTTQPPVVAPTTTQAPASSISSTTTTTTQPPQPALRQPADPPRMVVVAPDQMAAVSPALYSPVMHSSIQAAVSRIVDKMASSSAATSEAPPVATAAPANQSEKPAGEQSQGETTRAPKSLSLNLLLKHFGLANLTDFDHLLLRQRPRADRLAHNSTDDAEIHLEIKPVKEGDCIKATNERTTSTTTTASTSTTPSPSEDGASSPAAREPRARDQIIVRRPLAESILVDGSPDRRKFILKIPHEKQLHPLNNRFRVSQSFDITPAPARPSPYAPSGTSGESDAGNATDGDSLCDGLQRYATVGQLTSPEYPKFYPANVDCAFVIRRASLNYCRLSLHFRDFDLVNSNERDSPSVACRSDYLQIGETRYCNRYAMIGHKMKLDFPLDADSATPSIRLTFHSDHMQSGRGFLIKYQQLSCDEADEPGAGKAQRQPQTSTTMIGDLAAPRRQTLAPPLHQPDFGLALKTTPASAPTESPAESSSKRSKSKPTQPPSKKNKATNTAAPSGSNMIPMASTTTISNFLSLSQQQVVSGDQNSRGPTSRPADASQSSSVDCNQVNDEMSFLLRSVNYPEPYANNLQCLYYIKRNNTRVCYVELTFIKFELEADADCRFDYLEVNNIRLCGSLKDLAHKTTRVYLFNEPIKVVRFRSDGIGSKGGFFIKAEQLECAPNGSIVRKSKNLAAESVDLAAPRTSELNTTAMFVYDSLLSQRQSVITSSSPSQPESSSNSLRAKSRSGDLSPSVCDEVLYGREVTIKSPLWPESYALDDSLSSCKYTIVKSNIGKNKICQLELRFVNFRLGTSDCIDVDGFELLCGFNTRNLVKYYPFERQSHLTITFLSGTAKVGRGLSRDAHIEPEDILPTSRGPLRFMIIARQHECIDGFLAPQVESNLFSYNQTNLLYSNVQGATLSINGSSAQTGPRFVNRTSTPLTLGLGVDPPKTVKRPSEPSTGRSRLSDSTLTYSPPTKDISGGNFESLDGSSCLDGSIQVTSDQLLNRGYPNGYRNNAHCALRIPRQSSRICHLELELLDVNLETSLGGSCDSDYLQFNFGDRYCDTEQVERRLGAKRLLTLPFNRVNDYTATILFHSDGSRSGRGFLIRHRQVDCSALLLPAAPQPAPSESPKDNKLIGTMPLLSSGALSPEAVGPDASDRRCMTQFNQYNGILSSNSIVAKMKTDFPWTSECEIRIKLLPGFCQVQLTFGEFELTPRLSNFCLEYLELEGIQFCGSELKNSSRLLPMNELISRSVSMKFSTSNSSSFHGFRAIFKQIECMPEPLTGDPTQTTPPKPLKDSQTTRVDHQRPAEPTSETSPPPKVEFKEIVHRSEFFELNSAKISKSPLGYDPNVFLVYRIKRVKPQACKLRLMFYQFNLESSAGCKRDFLDVNNVDRLCGELGPTEERRRDYDWPSERDFLISFVSDSANQRDGFMVFGQQLESGCKSAESPSAPTSTTTTTPAPSTAAPTFDEEPSGDSKGQAAQGQSEQRVEMSGATPELESNCSGYHFADSFELASPGWPQRYGAKLACYYLVHRSRQDICSVSFNVVSMILDPDATEPASCDASRSDHLDIDGRVLCGSISRPKLVVVDFGKRQFVTLKFQSVAARGFGFFIEATQNPCRPPGASGEQSRAERPAEGAPGGADKSLAESERGQDGGCNQLLVGDVNVVESGNFPDSYANNLDCVYAVRRTNQSVCALDIVMNHFELEPASSLSGLCESDYLEVDYSRFCGQYPANHRIRFNYFDAELDKLLRFRSDATTSGRGFSLTVRQLTADCQPRPEANQGERTGDELIRYLADSSTGAAKVQPQVVEAAGAGVNTLCQFVYHAERQYLLSPGYSERRTNYDNNIDCLYKIVAKSYDFCALRLTMLDVDLEPSSECYSDYLLVDSLRLCGRFGASRRPANATGAQPTELEVKFGERLPREVHLRLHTSAYENSGRGFKLLYEQVACAADPSAGNFRLRTSDGQVTSQRERQARRSHFGSLVYPENYVSGGGARGQRADELVLVKSQRQLVVT